MDFLQENQKVWDQKVKDEDVWTRPVNREEVDKARKGDWNIVLTPSKSIPRDWFPKSLAGKKVLCLASGGGQQGPIMAAAGADVTVFDYSESQLSQDRLVAERDGLTIHTIQGDMRDLSVIDDETFDVIVHPWSNCFIDDVLPVWKEAYRVLKKGGLLLSGFANPVTYIFDLKAMNEEKFVVRHQLPYSDLTSISSEELQELVLDEGDAISFGHTLEDQIQGQMAAGFVLAGFYEDVGGSPLDQYMSGSMATKAIKL
ncbi:SAM-dependent methyltransferase [Salipaludibacillus keqinensis]|uniref:SAM-dependent methyltransferase n=1 Tax=Salipaludibacillus keqinensis TaxID=2045207 RepID=A0A323TMI8_9BACI|nr:class I SAM-dependent methyltransferase [Salipaludibacillus keqinensis]PYZ94867.1 SAM-dependent methyltransferase [Salipaludibacillus keqinensis]